MNLKSWFIPLGSIIDKHGMNISDVINNLPDRLYTSKSKVDLGAEYVKIDLPEFLSDVNNTDKDGFFIHPVTGEREPVYIHSTYYAASFDREELPKWHIMYCATLQSALRKDRIDSYAIKSNGADEKFVLTLAANGKEYGRSLRPCKHCLKKLFSEDGKHRESDAYQYMQFKKEFGKTVAPSMPNLVKYDNALKNHYSADWSAISAKLRREVGRCQKCSATNNLDVHHINEKKYDNSRENLMVVCRPCHEKIHGRHIPTNNKRCS